MVAGITTLLAAYCDKLGTGAINVALFFKLAQDGFAWIFIIINMAAWEGEALEKGCFLARD